MTMNIMNELKEFEDDISQWSYVNEDGKIRIDGYSIDGYFNNIRKHVLSNFEWWTRIQKEKLAKRFPEGLEVACITPSEIGYAFKKD